MGLASAVEDRDPVDVALDGATVHVQPLGYRKWRTLIESHPSEDRRLRWDRAKFVPAVFAACVVEAEDDDDVERFLLDARPGEVEKLLAAIVKAHEEEPATPTQPRE